MSQSLGIRAAAPIATTLEARSLAEIDEAWRIVAYQVVPYAARSEIKWAHNILPRDLRGLSICTGKTDGGYVLYARLMPQRRDFFGRRKTRWTFDR